jgi:hypothetical protein
MRKLTLKKQVLPFICAGMLGAMFSLSASADDPHYTAAKSQAEAVYDNEKAHCDTLSGNDKDICVKDAKAKRTAAEADAKAQHKAGEARTDANKDKLKADYKAAIERCDNLSGSEKDACQDRAKEKYKQ